MNWSSITKTTKIIKPLCFADLVKIQKLLNQPEPETKLERDIRRAWEGKRRPPKHPRG